jgi:alpha-L-fucosidase
MQQRPLPCLLRSLFLASLCTGAGLLAADPAGASATTTSSGRFSASDEALSRYECPEWFRDAKFGIWAHWGPQAVPRQGDWYAKRMYQGPSIDPKTGIRKEADPAYTRHLAEYGHPSKVGYKDLLPLWKAERWKPEELMALYRKAGARYFVSMGSHHDNFFLWNSKIHRWNSVLIGPKKDVVGLWQAAAKKEGLRFGVSEHLAASFTWFQSAHRADLEGPRKDVPYDGNDPQFQDLYHKPAKPGDTAWLSTDPEYQQLWKARVQELVDLYKPDLLYSDSGLPFGDIGRSLIAHYYNQDAARHQNRVEAVYTCKEDSHGRWVRDIERGVAEGIRPEPWQTDTSIGDWYYRTGQRYMSSGEVVRMLADIVSKNGNLLLNVVQTPEGDLEPDVLGILKGISSWVSINGEGIYGSRPWSVYGEGPSTVLNQEKGHFGGLKDVPTRPFTAEDFRFTTSKDKRSLFAFCFGVPEKTFQVRSLGTLSATGARKVASVELLGCGEKLVWSQTPEALIVEKPATLPSPEASCLKILFAD